ncbi:MAG: hydroxymethylglutaryl-CoA lyase [Acidobacteria bacterium]|nr:MAG: hydroxymethylglutaryl-CoA lyase [Acidobacteriota bacterium]
MPPGTVTLYEVGPRDGLQNEPTLLSPDQRAELVQRLAACGLRDIEIGSFVHPRWVPQMAETDRVAELLGEREGVRFWALVPNVKGYELAVEAGVRRVAVVVSASETHNRKNLNRSREESMAEIARIARACRESGVALRAYVSTALGCPYEGAIDEGEVIGLAERLAELGAVQVSLGDTIGAGTPRAVRRLARLAIERLGPERVALHLHDTRGLGLVNAYIALEEGVRILDGSVGGLGGCPYAPGAAGNVATEDLVQLLDGEGVPTEVDLDALVETALWLERLGLQPASRYARFRRASCRHDKEER